MKKFYLFTCLCCAILWPALLSAQTIPRGNNNAGIQKTTALFYNAISDNAGLYNGTEYIMYDLRIKGMPYFFGADMQAGDLSYNGTIYTGVPMLYETTTGNLVIRQFGNGVLLNLVNEKVGYFTLFNHTFIHLVPDSTNKIISNDFYDRIYNGTTVVYVKRAKIVSEDPNTFEKSFTEINHYFILKNDTYYPVNDRGDVLTVFKDKKKDLIKYMRQNDIKYKKEPEYAMAKMAEYFDKLTH